MIPVEGWFAFALLWYVAVSACGVYFGNHYNRWIEEPHGQQTATCYQVVIGVAATEFMRVIRITPLAILLAPILCHEVDWWVTPLVILGGWPVDAFLAYACTGWPMIRGDLKRKAMARDEGPGAIVTEAAQK